MWLSASADLYVDAKRDLDGIDAGHIPVALINDFNISDTIDMPDGVLFSTYPSLISESKSGTAKRLDQIVKWLGDDGVIIFDESHKAKNALAQEGGKSTQTGQAVLDIQEIHLPLARVVYSSATGATDVRNMAYMTRLGLWGEGTSFDNFIGFMKAIDAGGVGAMEIAARDMKAMGKYISRSISFEGVEYEEVIHNLTEEQRKTYDLAAKAWQVVLQNINEAIAVTGANSRAKAFAMRKFWGDLQRFFKQMIMATKVPTLLKQVDAEIANGNSVVIGLIGTGESRTVQQVNKQISEGKDLEELDFSPREILAGLVDKSFPTVQFIEVQDPVTGKKTSVPMKDKDGNVVQSKEALRIKENLLSQLSDLSFPENPLDQIINYFRPEKIAELTGRKKRLIKNPETGKVEYVKRAPDGVAMKKVNQYEMKQFQDGKKRIAIISDAASTGISLHSDLGTNNQQKRVHITLELGWSADKQMQTFGRTHRSNQKVAPKYTLLSTDVGGEKRFSSTIARRLESLGALTKGQRDTTGGGSLAKYNFETVEGVAALTAMYRSIMNGVEVIGIDDAKQALRDMGVLISGQDGKEYIPDKVQSDISKFLNRILAIDIHRQNAMFTFFSDIFDSVVTNAKETGTFDDGVTDIKGALQLKFKEKNNIYTDAVTGAKTDHIVINSIFPTHPTTFQMVQNWQRQNKNTGFYKHNKSGHFVYAAKIGSRTDAETGQVIDQIKLYKYTGEADRIDSDDFAEKYDNVKPDEASDWWNEKVANYPKQREEDVHLISGVILPFWEKIQNNISNKSQEKVKISRVVTDDGQRFIGVRLPKSSITRVLRAIGIQQTITDPGKIFDTVLEGRESISLDRGLKFVPTRLHGEDTIELSGGRYEQFDRFREIGLINEKISWQERFFIPTDKEVAVTPLTI